MAWKRHPTDALADEILDLLKGSLIRRFGRDGDGLQEGRLAVLKALDGFEESYWFSAFVHQRLIWTATSYHGRRQALETREVPFCTLTADDGEEFTDVAECVADAHDDYVDSVTFCDLSVMAAGDRERVRALLEMPQDSARGDWTERCIHRAFTRRVECAVL